jgi:hypothetical protein
VDRHASLAFCSEFGLSPARYQAFVSSRTWLGGCNGAWLLLAEGMAAFQNWESGMRIGGTVALSILGTWLALSLPAQAGSIGFNYSFTGGLTAAPDFEADGLHLQASATGSLNAFDPALNSALNPVTFDTKDVLDLSTGLDNGTFTWTFANGDTLTGTMFEDDTAVNFATNTGPFLQNLTITGGTGAFAGATGSTSGNGLLAAPTFTITGNGIVSAAGLVSVPEPGSLPVMLGVGLVGAIALRRRKTALTNCRTQI